MPDTTDPRRTLLGEPAADLDTIPDTKPELNRTVFFGSAGLVVAFTLFTLLAPEASGSAIGSVVGWISDYFGWWYFALAAGLIAFVLFICLSRYGRIRLGPEESRPEYSLFTWTAMLFAAGIGADLMFYSVAEPVSQYLTPPTGEGSTIAAAEQAVSWTLFHYGLSGWAMYAVMGMALGYFSFRHGLPLSIRSALYPIFGKRIQGRLGDGIDLAAVLGTIFGIATSLGISIALLNAGLNVLFDIPEGRGAQVGLVVVAVLLGTISAVSGVDKGIRRLSELNVLLSLGLMLYVLFSDDTAFLLNSLVMNLGDYLVHLPGMSFDTMPYATAENPDVGVWKNLWTLFFWAWWVAWAPFVGLFLARISRGRTIRQFLVGVMMIPFGFILLWVSIFGNSALGRIRGGDAEFGELTNGDYAQGFYAFLDAYPAATLVIAVATLTGFLYYVTSADSGALVMGNFTSRLPHPMADCSIPVRIFWSFAIGALTLALMFAGGDDWLTTITNATIIMGLPFSIVLALVAVGLYRSLRLESFKTESVRYALPAAISSARVSGAAEGGVRPSLSQRLRRSVTYPTAKDTERFIATVAKPVLDDVAAELNGHGLTSVVTETKAVRGVAGVQLHTDLEDAPAFVYKVTPCPCRAPTFAVGRVTGELYFRTEVHLAEGTQGYDVNAYSREQLMGDVLDQYERHLSYLHLVQQEQISPEVPDVPASVEEEETAR
ncbi:choline/glycine/proline betaine transport protein [Nocardioides albertanoniae]|uniref:Choline/glycine/proline betaine transport protein n=1 Tax=Nocardioides albertanoniae TaxID=1175486 RepID=A0A543A8U6_9ACTN|nr:choline BCCT transporter BetT [Nocardioides albertanoniae]TQL69021.1 choline/glycine/proline betaine transport protein [Nocardioides albertanoniae]